MIAAARPDKDRAFRDEALPHLDAVFRFALRLTGSRDDADDLVQDTFVRAYRSWDRYTPGTECRSWLFTICKNLFLKRRERDAKRAELLDRAIGFDPLTGLKELETIGTSAALDPEEWLERETIDSEIVSAIRSLPEPYRGTLIRSDVQGLQYEEIAEEMRVPVGTVKSRLSRARERLRGMLMDYAVTVHHFTPMRDRLRESA